MLACGRISCEGVANEMAAVERRAMGQRKEIHMNEKSIGQGHEYFFCMLSIIESQAAHRANIFAVKRCKKRFDLLQERREHRQQIDNSCYSTPSTGIQQPGPSHHAFQRCRL